MIRPLLINFVKASENAAQVKRRINSNDAEEVVSFYENVVFRSAAPDASQPVTKIASKLRSKGKRKASAVSFSSTSKSIGFTEMFLHCERNDLVKMDQCLKNGFPIDSQDMYGWTALMVCACQKRKEAAAFLLRQGASPLIKNKKGDTALDIAAKVDFQEFFHFPTSASSSEAFPSKVVNDSDFPGYCNECSMFTDEMRRHCTSMAHLISKKHNPPQVASFALGTTNRGYQLMRQQGWTGHTGLGADESGRLYPIKTVKKNDRLGVGSKAKPSASTEKLNLSFKELARRRKHEQNLERRFRQHFNYD